MDYEYYVNKFGGTALSEGAFRRASEEAAVLLLAMIYPKSEKRFTEAERGAFQCAVCYEAEFLAASGGAGEGEMGNFFSLSGSGSTTGSSSRIKSERIGDYSVSYQTSTEKTGQTVNGMTISPAAASLLLHAGLTSRWV